MELPFIYFHFSVHGLSTSVYFLVWYESICALSCKVCIGYYYKIYYKYI